MLFLRNYLHISKKSSTFALAFEKRAFMVVLAQLAEHRIVVPSVVGSSPTFHPNIEKSASYAENIEKSVKKRSNEFPYFDTIFLRYNTISCPKTCKIQIFFVILQRIWKSNSIHTILLHCPFGFRKKIK